MRRLTSNSLSVTPLLLSVGLLCSMPSCDVEAANRSTPAGLVRRALQSLDALDVPGLRACFDPESVPSQRAGEIAGLALQVERAGRDLEAQIRARFPKSAQLDSVQQFGSNVFVASLRRALRESELMVDGETATLERGGAIAAKLVVRNGSWHVTEVRMFGGNLEMIQSAESILQALNSHILSAAEIVTKAGSEPEMATSLEALRKETFGRIKQPMQALVQAGRGAGFVR